MIKTRSGVDAVISIPVLIDPNTITAASWSVYNDAGTVLYGPNSISPPFLSAISVTVPASHNTVPLGQWYSGRVIHLQLTTAAGVVNHEVIYLVEGSDPLTILENSFQSLVQAEVEAASMSDVAGWTGSTNEIKIKALIDAFHKLTRFGYTVRWARGLDAQSFLDSSATGDTARIHPRMWAVMTLDHFNSYYPEEFRKALRRAQIIEANAIISPDPVYERRVAGIASERIGESAMSFGGGKGIGALDLGVSPKTFEALSGYIQTRLTIGRA